MGVEAKTDDGACGGTGPARTHTPLKATGLPPAVPSLQVSMRRLLCALPRTCRGRPLRDLLRHACEREQTIVMDQIMPGEEIGCWIPGRELIPAMLRWICETYAFETVRAPRHAFLHVLAPAHAKAKASSTRKLIRMRSGIRFAAKLPALLRL